MLYSEHKRPRLTRNWPHILLGSVAEARAAIDPKFRGEMRVALMESLEGDMTPEDKALVREMLAEYGWPSGTA
jgi:hypothetical protein